MSRSLSAAVLVLAVLAVLAGVRLSSSGDGAETGCPGVRRAYDRASFIEGANDVPTSKIYAEAAGAVRQVAVVAPPAIATDLNHVADAYGQLGALLQGFDPGDDATYHVVEGNTVLIERQQTEVDIALPRIGEWLDNRCR